MQRLEFQPRSGTSKAWLFPFCSTAFQTNAVFCFYAIRERSIKWDTKCGWCAGPHISIGWAQPKGREGDRFHVNRTPSDSASSFSFQKRNQGVFLFIKQNETKTTLIPNNTIANSQTKRGRQSHWAQVLNDTGILEGNKKKLNFPARFCGVSNWAFILFPMLVTRGE